MVEKVKSFAAWVARRVKALVSMTDEERDFFNGW